MYCHAFLEHEISGSELMSLERSDFKDAGVTKVSLNFDFFLKSSIFRLRSCGQPHLPVVSLSCHGELWEV